MWAVDRDPAAVRRAQRMAEREEYAGRLFPLHCAFGDLDARLPAALRVDAAVFDLGVSTEQLTDAARGFSLRLAGPLDMRMDPALEVCAADIVNWYSAARLAALLAADGEEPFANRIADAIVQARRAGPIASTLRLAEIVAAAAPVRNARAGSVFVHPATRTFQALRIAVNDELTQVRAGLAAAFGRISPGGLLIVVSFHALEDRIVKAFNSQCIAGRPAAAPHSPADGTAAAAIAAGHLVPRDAEIAANRQSRSAKLRAITKK